MRCYLMRHGEAKAGADDPARPLSDRGLEEVQRVARHAAALGLEVAEIRHSGKLRARQTAEILAEHLKPRLGTHEVQGLAPNDDPAKVRTELEVAKQPLMLVGHLPHLNQLASALLVGDPKKEIISLGIASVVCLARSEAGFRLIWLLTPETAR